MPKPIKKKLQKQVASTEDDVSTYLSKIQTFADKWKRQIAIGSVVLLVVIISIVSIYFYYGSLKKQAQDMAYQGYSMYFGLNEQVPIADKERYSTSLESFKKSYDMKKTPFALYYIANCQYELGMLDDAISSLKRLVADFRNNELYVPLAYYKMAMTNMKAGRSEDALKNLENIYSGNFLYYKDLALMESARILDELGRKDEAVEKYAQLAKQYPESVFAEEAIGKSGEVISKEKSEEKVSQEKGQQ